VTARLILDAFTRGSRVCLLSLPVLVYGWSMVAASRLPRETILALSMSVAFCIGAMLTQGLVTRAVVAMPIAARQLWLARWWLGTAVAVLCTALPKLLIPIHGWSFALLSMLCDFAYTGVWLALWPVFDIKPRGPLWLRAFLTRSGMILWLLTIGGGAAAWSFVLRPVLPTEWAHLRGPAGLVVLAALAVTLWGYRYSPPAGAPRELARTRSSPASPSPAHGQATKRAATRRQMTGIGLVLWRDAVVALVYAAIVVGIVLVATWVERPAGVSATTMQVIALLVAIPLFRWLAVWSIVAILFALDGRAPARLGLDTLAAFTGIAAAMHAAGLRWNNIRRASMLMVILAGLVVAALGVQIFPAVTALAERLGLSPPAFVGLVTLAGACLLHYDTLTRRSVTYRLPHIVYDAYTPGVS
jgi:hypothetical protein